jgi:hypothetical protein
MGRTTNRLSVWRIPVDTGTRQLLRGDRNLAQLVQKRLTPWSFSLSRHDRIVSKDEAWMKALWHGAFVTDGQPCPDRRIAPANARRRLPSNLQVLSQQNPVSATDSSGPHPNYCDEPATAAALNRRCVLELCEVPHPARSFQRDGRETYGPLRTSQNGPSFGICRARCRCGRSRADHEAYANKHGRQKPLRLTVRTANRSFACAPGAALSPDGR